MSKEISSITNSDTPNPNVPEKLLKKKQHNEFCKNVLF